MSVPQLQELLLKLSLDAAKLGFGVSPLLRALALDIHHLIQCGDQLLIGVLQGLQVHHATLGLTGGFPI